jgi:hypothetical protein
MLPYFSMVTPRNGQILPGAGASREFFFRFFAVLWRGSSVGVTWCHLILMNYHHLLMIHHHRALEACLDLGTNVLLLTRLYSVFLGPGQGGVAIYARVKRSSSLASASQHTLPRRARAPCRCRVCTATQGTPKTFVVKEAERSLGDGGGRGVIFFEGANKLVLITSVTFMFTSVTCMFEF